MSEGAHTSRIRATLLHYSLKGGDATGLGETPGQGNVGSGCVSHTIHSVPSEVRECSARRTT